MFARVAALVPATGVVFAVLVIVATFLKNVPGSGASDAAWTSYYADSGNRRGEVAASILVGLAGLCFLQFLGSVRGRLARVEGEPARITTAAVASGTAFITLAVAAHAVGTSYSWAVNAFGADLNVDPDTARLLAGLSSALFSMSMFLAAAMALAVATLAFWMRALPTWLAVVSALAVIGGVLGFLGFPSVVVLAWIVLLSLYLVWPREEPRATQPARDVAAA